MKRLCLFLFAALITSQMWAIVYAWIDYGTGSDKSMGTIEVSTKEDFSNATYSSSNSAYFYFRATKKDGYRFVGWYVGSKSAPSSWTATGTYTANPAKIWLSSSQYVYAFFEKDDSSSGGSTSGGGGSTATSQTKTYTLSGTSYTMKAYDMGTGDNILWGDRAIGAELQKGGAYFAYSNITTANAGYTNPCSSVKYTSSNNLAAEYDAATRVIGAGWRMPTKTEMCKLVSTATFVGTVSNGALVTVTNNNNTIYFYYGDKKANGSVGNQATSQNAYAYYWTSTKYDDDESYRLSINKKTASPYINTKKGDDHSYNYYGQQVHPVYDASDYTLTVKLDGTTSTTYSAVWGTTKEYTAFKSGYEFVRWNDGNTDNPRTFYVCDKVYTAEFEKKVTTAINVSANPAEAAKSVTATAVANGSSTLTAVANEGYEFVNWTEGTTVLGTSASYTYNNITESHNVVANFAKVEAISRTADNNGVNKNFTSSSVPENAVDLGLSVMWADRNLGATSSDGEFSSQGLRYAWGETKARKGNLQEMFDADHYLFAANNPEQLATANDAAYQADHSWRMPTKAEFEELINKCTWTYKSTTPKGWVISRNGNSIFLPFDGYYEGSNSLVSTAACFYWTSELKEGTGAGKKPYFFAASSSLKAVGNGALIGGNYTINAYAGLCIRPVTDAAPAAQAYTLTIRAIYCGVTSTNTYICNAGQVIRIKPDAAGVTWYNSNNVVCNEGNDNLDVTMNSNQAFTVVFDNSTIAVEEDQIIHEDDIENGAVKDLTSGEETPETEVPAEAVDLGLSVMWAEVNVGATKDNMNGGFYAWAETDQKQSYTWDNYTYSNGNSDKVTKYAIKGGYGGFKDNKTALEDADDAAIVGLQGAWRMPTKAEWKELADQCTWTWKVKDHSWGYEIVGSTGNSIFLPAAGMKSSSTTMLEGKRGYYWSSNLGSGESKYASCMKFSDADYLLSTDTRYCGMSIRPVCPAPAAKCTLTIVINGGTKKNTYVGYPGQTVTIKAEAKTTANFLRWNDGNTENPRIFTLRGDAQYTAFFDDENATDLYEGTDNGNWEDSSNWRNEGKPTATTNVTLDQPIQVGPATPNPETPVQAIAQNLTLQEGGDLKVNDGATLTITEDLNIEAGASVTIAPGAVVRVEGIISSDQANAIVIQSDENGVGSLIVSTSEEVHPYGSVQLYTVAKKINEENYQWQHFGIPTMEKPTITKSQDVGTYYYSWDTDEGWVNKIGSAALVAPFVGHNLTNLSTDGGVVYTFSGQLVGNKVDSMKFVTDGWALLANSYTVPVSIKAILEALPDGMERTIQVYNPIYGENKANYMQSVTMGQINLGVAKITELLPMQAFFVLANGEGGSSLNYRSAAVMPSSAPQEAPRRATNSTSAELTIKISDNNGGEDGLDLYEVEGTTATEKNDIDATKQMSGAPLIYAKKEGTELNAYASGNLVGTVIGLNASNATNYTLTVKGQSGTTYSLYDNVAKATVLLNNETEYHFSADAKSVNAARFVIRNVSTDCDEITEQHTPAKVISDQQVVIIREGERYSILGTRL